MDILVTILTGLLVLIGLIAAVIPAIPDISLVWAATLGYGLIVGWGESGPWLFGAISVLGLLGVAADVWVSSAGAKMGGASLWSVVAGILSGIVGLFIFGPLGLVGGMALGTFLVELSRRKDASEALKAVLGVGLGYGASFLVKFLLSVGMAALWVAWVIIR